jgi:hypothetical protein
MKSNGCWIVRIAADEIPANGDWWCSGPHDP